MEAEEPVSLSVQSGLWTSNVPGTGDPDKKLLSGGACVLPYQLRVLPRWRKQGADTPRLIRPLPGLRAHSRWFSLHVREPRVHTGLLRLGGSPKDRCAQHHPGLHHRDTGGETGLLQVLIPQLQHWTRGDSHRGAGVITKALKSPSPRTPGARAAGRWELHGQPNSPAYPTPCPSEQTPAEAWKAQAALTLTGVSRPGPLLKRPAADLCLLGRVSGALLGLDPCSPPAGGRESNSEQRQIALPPTLHGEPQVSRH